MNNYHSGSFILVALVLMVWAIGIPSLRLLYLMDYILDPEIARKDLEKYLDSINSGFLNAFVLLTDAIILLLGVTAKQPELVLVLVANLIGIIYMVTSNDWLVTITGWELFNLSLYLLVSSGD